MGLIIPGSWVRAPPAPPNESPGLLDTSRRQAVRPTAFGALKSCPFGRVGRRRMLPRIPMTGSTISLSAPPGGAMVNRGPLVTLLAVFGLVLVLLAVNYSRQPEPAGQAAASSAAPTRSDTTAPPATVTSAPTTTPS